jgi:hypothetical protein
MTGAEAQVVVDVLLEGGSPSTLSWGEQVLEYGRVLRCGPPEAQARVLASLYSVEDPDPPRLLMISRFEDQLLQATADALGRPLGELRAMLHEGRAAFSGDAPWRAEEGDAVAPVAPTGWQATGSFRVFGGALVFGEAPQAELEEGSAEAAAAFARPALNGVWFTWSVPIRLGLWRRLFGRAGLEEVEHVALHESVLPEAPGHLSHALPLGQVWVHGGTSSAVDVEVREDRQFLSSLEHGEETGRGFTVGLGGDGEVTWRGTEQNGELVLVVLAAPS